MKSPSIEELEKQGFMRKVEDELVMPCFQSFLCSPRLKVIREDENFSNEFSEAEVWERLAGRPFGDAIVPIHATIASYSSREDQQGKLLLSSVCNFPAQRFGIPLQAESLDSLLNNGLKAMRIYNIFVQHNSIVTTTQEQHELMSFPEWNPLSISASHGKKKRKLG